MKQVERLVCNDYRFRPDSERPFEEFAQLRIELVFPSGKPNIEPRDDIRIGDEAPVITRAGQATVALQMTKWAWKGPHGKPVFNFRSDGRSFANSLRCVIPADGFYEFTDPVVQKRKTKWLFEMAGSRSFWIAGIIKESAFAMLTTEPGPDVAPYHDRQIVLLPQGRAMDWLDLSCPEAELFAPLPAGALTVERIYPVSTTPDR